MNGNETPKPTLSAEHHFAEAARLLMIAENCGGGMASDLVMVAESHVRLAQCIADFRR